MNHAAKIWEETVLLPTYPAAEPENIRFSLKNAPTRGSTGKVYPLPVTEKVSDVCREVAYHAVWLETSICASWSCPNWADGFTAPSTRPTAMILSIQPRRQPRWWG